MAIPTSDLKRQVRTPGAAKGGLPDLSQMVAESYRPAIETMAQINQTVGIFAKAEIAKRKADAQIQAEDALNEYFGKADAEADSLQQRKGAEALKYADEYYKKTEEAHKQALLSIDGIKDQSIRENARSQINNYNLKTRGQVNSYLFNQDQLMKDQSALDYQQQEEKDFYRDVDTNGVATALEFDNKFAKIANSKILRGTTKGESPERISADVEAKRVEMAGNTARILATKGIESGELTAYAPAMEFVYSLKGKMPKGAFLSLAQGMEKERLAYEVAAYPSAFIKDQKIDRKKIEKYTPSLTPYERQLFLADLASTFASASKTINPADMPEILGFNVAVDDDLRQTRIQLGYGTDSDLFSGGLIRSEEEKKAMREEQLARRKKPGQLSKIFDYLQTVINYAETPIAVNRSTGAFEEVPTAKMQKEAADNGWTVILRPINDQRYIQNLSLAKRMAEDALKNAEEPGSHTHWSIKDVASYSMLKQMKNAAKENKAQIDMLSLTKGIQQTFRNLNEIYPGKNLDESYDALPETKRAGRLSKEDVWEQMARAQQATYKSGTRAMLAGEYRTTKLQDSWTPGERDTAYRLKRIYESRYNAMPLNEYNFLMSGYDVLPAQLRFGPQLAPGLASERPSLQSIVTGGEKREEEGK